jgi:hypothetical protein
VTLLEARAILVPPFRFGATDQIAASDFIALFEDASLCLGIAGYSRFCDWCDGEAFKRCTCDCGRIGHHIACASCDGTGAVPVTAEYLETLDETRLTRIIAELRELGMGPAAPG